MSPRLAASAKMIAMIIAVSAGSAWLFSSPAGSRLLNARPESDPAAQLEQSGQVFRQVAETVSPAVIYIEASQRDKDGKVYSEESGSGVLIRLANASNPVGITNLHVVVNTKPEDIRVHLADGRLVHPKRLWTDRDTDLAILELGETDLASARLGDSSGVYVGQWVLAIGSPFGLMQSVTHGIVSATHRRQLGLPQTMRIKEFIQTDAPINPGSSGGPLVNLRGEVIGINTAIASHTGGSSGVGFAIPASIVERVVSDLAQYGRVRRAFLGVEFPRQFKHERAVELGLPMARGALVTGVAPNTPAAIAGLAVNDVILDFNGQPVEDDNHLINMVSQAGVGTTVKLTVWREQKKGVVEVKLGDWNQYQAEHASK